MLLVKIGGGENINIKAIAEDLKELERDYLVVHGANAVMTEITNEMGKEERIIESPSGFTSRYTDQETLDIFLQSYSGLANKRVVETFQKLGVNAVGLSGLDGRLWQGERKKKILGVIKGKTKVIRNSYTGKVEKVNSDLINLLIEGDYVPIITSPAISYDGEIINVDNDRAIASMVKALQIEEVVSLFGAPGLLKNREDRTSLIKELNYSELDDAYEYAEGRMKKKVLGAKEAFDNGLIKMYWGSGKVKDPVLSALKGNGTTIKNDN